MFCPPEYIPFGRLLRRYQEERRDAYLQQLELDYLEREEERAVLLASSTLADRAEEGLFFSLPDELFVASPTRAVQALDGFTIDAITMDWGGLNVFQFAAAAQEQSCTELVDEEFLGTFRLFRRTWSEVAARLKRKRAEGSEIPFGQAVEEMGFANLHHVVPPSMSASDTP